MIDLHIHSTASDGQYSPKEIVDIAVRNGLKAIALTDHDTIAGIEEGDREAKRVGIHFIPGIEISVQGLMGRKELHILGYKIDPGHQALKNLCQHLQELRLQRSEKIFVYLKEKGVPVKHELIEKFSQGGPIGRPHFVQAMVEMGYVSDARQAFDLYLDTPDFKQIPRPLPTAQEGIEAIQEAGGVPVLAHPIQTSLSSSDLERLLLKLKSWGLKGLECYYSTHTPEDTGFYLQLARKYDLVVTGGSDFHGEKIKPTIKMGRGINHSLCVPDELIFSIIKE